MIDSSPGSGADSSSMLVECPEIRENLTSLAVSLKHIAMKVMDLFLDNRTIICLSDHCFLAHPFLTKDLFATPCLEDMDTGPFHAVTPSVITVEPEEISISNSEVIDPLLFSVVE
ncbi:hypothetical protein [Halalkalicoccus salilacus]|uniref:hypothetical protein n=1 Tax=Halalkalicoccus sp. GCM10025704 TaxID=3252662 RepID=UPI0036112D02